MRELILVSISALLGYIVFSAFSSSDTPKEAIKKIIEQPYQSREVSQNAAFKQADNKHEENIITLENEHSIATLEVNSNVKIHEVDSQTKVELKKLDNELTHQIAVLKMESIGEDKNKDNSTYVVLALLIFLLIFIYLKYKKQLMEIELEKQERYHEMIAKKEYAEKILLHISEGNLSFETERKLLDVLDELNGKVVKPLNESDFYHPNPDIIQLTHSRKSTK